MLFKRDTGRAKTSSLSLKTPTGQIPYWVVFWANASRVLSSLKISLATKEQLPSESPRWLIRKMQPIAPVVNKWSEKNRVFTFSLLRIWVKWRIENIFTVDIKHIKSSIPSHCEPYQSIIVGCFFIIEMNVKYFLELLSANTLHTLICKTLLKRKQYLSNTRIG